VSSKYAWFRRYYGGRKSAVVLPFGAPCRFWYLLLSDLFEAMMYWQKLAGVPLRQTDNGKIARARTKVTKKHSFSRSLLASTWLDKQKLLKKIICRFRSLWLVLPHPRCHLIAWELSIGKNSVIDRSSFCREVCVFWLEQWSEIWGGSGVVVEIDEAKIGHRKYNRGRWVDGF